MQAGSSIALPPGVTLDLLEADANTYETFVARKDAADLGVSVAILGQNLSSEVSGPVSTGATLHGRVMQVYIDADAETLSTCVHDQALVWWAEVNFGTRDLAPWPDWDTSPPEDEAARAAVLNVVAQAINVLSNAGAPIDVRVLLESYGVPLKDAKDIEQSGQVFKYHLDYGILTTNEIRERLGLPAVKGGDEAPKPMAAAAGGDPNATDAAAKAFITTRAGRTIRAQSGFVQGQLYADAVADAARDRAASVLDPDVVAVLEAIDAGTSYDDIRARLLKTYRGMSPDQLAKLTEAAFTMAELGGRHAINEDR
jgi:phage gp29-like protein